jgi:hypothetical protein
LIRTQAPQQVSGFKKLHNPLFLQLAPLFTAILGTGTGETAALGAATATVLESARMNASEEIVKSTHSKYFVYKVRPKAGFKLGLAQG